ncbi:peptidylprolyl isomerase [Aneurinibacillus tyrosinisolvens]|uniref:peptidylprolyl isomerase n=1 Tax=Aneurinibacillus tyrosinisolvens TaxID=1443435 RepID=UPI00063F6686|nr:peptidylprolyl isomerase [Aneurinibacillus tyrosinisolvens]
MKRISFIILLAVALVFTMAACSANSGKNPEQGKQEAQPKQPAKQWASAPPMAIDPNKTYIAHMETNKGNISIELLAKEAPKTVNNFVFLSREKFYDGVIFHRVIKDFMIQGGDPLGTGTGGPGYNIEDELPVKRKYEKGIVAMARTNQPNSGGSQFFICNGPGAAGLNTQPDYVIFGKVIDGMDTVDKISNVQVTQSPTGEESVPVEKVFVKTITIEEK